METILETAIQSSTYYSTVCPNSYSLFYSYNKQLIAVVGGTGDVEVGSAR